MSEWTDGAPTEPGRYVMEFDDGTMQLLHYALVPLDDCRRHLPIPDPHPAPLPLPKVFRARVGGGPQELWIQPGGTTWCYRQMKSGIDTHGPVERDELTDIQPIPNPWKEWAEKYSIAELLKDSAAFRYERNCKKHDCEVPGIAARELEALKAANE